MTFIPALLGALVGGLFAIFVAHRTGVRTTRNALADKIRELTAEVTSNAAMIQDVVAEYQTRTALAEQSTPADDEREEIRLDGNRLREYELNITRALGPLGWLTYKSPLYTFVTNLTTEAGKLISSWSGGHAKWLERREAFDKHIEALDDAVKWFTHLRLSAQAAFLRSVNLPLPPPAGARPAGWPPKITRWTLAGFWFKTAFVE